MNAYPVTTRKKERKKWWVNYGAVLKAYIPNTVQSLSKQKISFEIINSTV
jgi:hypothetical protein